VSAMRGMADTGLPKNALGNQKFLRAFFKKRCLLTWSLQAGPD
jgi:hypothetical protein